MSLESPRSRPAREQLLAVIGLSFAIAAAVPSVQAADDTSNKPEAAEVSPDFDLRTQVTPVHPERREYAVTRESLLIFRDEIDSWASESLLRSGKLDIKTLEELIIKLSFRFNVTIKFTPGYDKEGSPVMLFVMNTLPTRTRSMGTFSRGNQTHIEETIRIKISWDHEKLAALRQAKQAAVKE